MTQPKIDPITFELFKNAIFSIADEMALTVFDAVHTPVDFQMANDLRQTLLTEIANLD